MELPRSWLSPLKEQWIGTQHNLRTVAICVPMTYFWEGLLHVPHRESTTVKYRLDFVEELVGQFWKKWIRDMFPNLIKQPKWHVKIRDVCVGDVVMIQDTNILRGRFKMGIVVETFLSHDGKIRKVKVGYNNTEGALERDSKNYTYIERAVDKLIVIVPVESANDVENN